MAVAPPDSQTSPRPARRRTGPMIIALLVVILLVLHQDNWFWESDALVFGIMPIALFYHACISISATCVWLLATKIAWPVEIIEQAKAAAADSSQDSEGQR